MPSDPVVQFKRWFRQAEQAKLPLPEACALATATRDGRPSVRYVLLKGIDERGFVFFTDSRSRKGRELRENPRAALAFYWSGIIKQVRIEGTVSEVSAAEADAYWATRPAGSRISATISHQSSILDDRMSLVSRWRELSGEFIGRPIPRPAYWKGFRIKPSSIEFWKQGKFRLHHRERFLRRGAQWKRELLQP